MQELKELLFKMYKAQCAQEIELFNRGVEEGAGMRYQIGPRERWIGAKWARIALGDLISGAGLMEEYAEWSTDKRNESSNTFASR